MQPWVAEKAIELLQEDRSGGESVSDYMERKESVILSALNTLEKNGYECRLCNMQNGHIQVKSAHGIIYNFYPTTGTIAGFEWEVTHGMDNLLQILENR